MFNGIQILQEAALRHNIHFCDLIAETSIWANPEVHRRLFAADGVGAYVPGCRRAKKGEERGQRIGSEVLDDNSRANDAIKRMAGLDNSKIVHFHTCHIWPGSCYDSHCHTVIANLVLIPSPLAGLSDHDPETLAALKFRAFELYRWHPPGHEAPARPAYYPVGWREPEPFTPEIETYLVRRNYGPGG